MNGGKLSDSRLTSLSRLRQYLRPKLSIRVFLYFFAISLVPVVFVSYLLISSANNQLLNDTAKRQESVAKNYAKLVENTIESNLDQLSYLARLYSSSVFTFQTSEKQLTELLIQNPSLVKIRILTVDGRELTLKIDGNKISKKIATLPSTVSAVATIFGDNNRPYILSVGKDPQDKKPQMNIGVPILKTYDNNFSNAANRFQKSSKDNIIGAIQGFYDISALWDGFVQTNVTDKNNRSAYVVDGSGNLASHSDSTYLQNFSKIDKSTKSLQQIKNNDSTTQQTDSERFEQVLSSPVKLKYGLNWGVVVQEKISSIYSGVYGYVQSAAIVSIIAIILSVLAAIYFGRQISRPLQILSQGAKRMESGDFSAPINVNTHDEFEELAGSFNNMSEGISTLIKDLQTNNMRLIIEKAKLNNIISSVSDGILALNRKNEIISANPQASLLLTVLPSDLKGKKVSDQFNWEKDGAQFTPDLEKPGVYRYDDLVLRNKEAVFYLDLVVAVLEKDIADTDEDVAAIITIRDQTATRELSFMKLDFVAIAAHELRTPLTVVRGYLDMLNTSAMKQMSVYNLENLQKAIVGANQLRELINKLLNIARIERGDMEIFIEKLDINKLVSENVDQHVSVAAQKQQIIEYSSSSQDPVYVPADPASLVEVMNNLLGNALKYTSKGGKVAVNLSVENELVKVTVADNGPGIPTDLRGKLFTKFYRAERSMIAGSRGTGLGLFISKTIIDLQHGTIGIAPDGGHGSTFYFTLPLYNAERDDPLITKKTSGGIRGWFKKRTNSRG